MSQTDLRKLDAMADEEIDFSEIPPLTDDQLSAMKPLREVFPDAVQEKVTQEELQVMRT